MSYATLILGESGTGKTASLKNMDPTKTLLIQPVRKPLPFRPKGWHEAIRDEETGRFGPGNIVVSCNPSEICLFMRKSKAEVIVIDDWQYILSFMYMAKRQETGFQKFTTIGGAGFDIVKLASELAPNKRVYVLAHTTKDDFGVTRIKTLGKLLDDKICVEGLFTVVLRTHVDQGKYTFSTQNDGYDTVKSPEGLFESPFIENDLHLVDAAICSYYGIGVEQSDSEGTGAQS